MENVVLAVHLILALCLIGVVLLQRSEGGGLGIGGGGGAMSARGAATALTKITWGLAIAFIVTSLTLTILAAQKTSSSSIMDQFGGTAPVSEPETPSIPRGNDLLPPPPVNAPQTPPRVDSPAPVPPAQN